MTAATVSRWARRFLLASGTFLALAAGAGVTGVSDSTVLVLGFYGFVLSAVFGKAYSLVPSYFDRTLDWPAAPAIQWPLHVAGTVGLALEPVGGVPAATAPVSAILWAAGVAVFLATILATVRDNLMGRETGTSEANRDRAGLDRLANAFVPVAFAYLAVGTVELVSGHLGGPTLFGGAHPRVAHLLAAGFAALLLFAVGFRLLPRFLVSRVPTGLAVVVLPAGAVGPALIASGLYEGLAFRVGAAFEALAVAGFAVAFFLLFVRTDRDRVGFYGPLLGVVAGLLGVGLGLQFALDGLQAGLTVAHQRLNVFGFLGLTILGVVYQFYPPAVGQLRWANDRTAFGTLGLAALGVAGAAVGPLVARTVEAVGFLALGVAALGFLYLLGATMAVQTGRG